VPTSAHPPSYEEAARKAGVSSTVHLGVRPVRVKRIVGSAGKADKIGPDFLPLGTGGSAGRNFRDILTAMKKGADFPPISVYQLGNRYFVIDGHTRVAAAKQLDIDFLDADVIEALPRKEGNVNLTYYARREFARQTGMEGIRLTAPWRYHLLLHHIEGYRLYLERSRSRDVSLPEAAQIWYRSQYQPTLREIRRRKLVSEGEGRTAGDIYTDILRQWAEEEGLAVSLREMLDRFDQSSRERQGKIKRAKRAVSDIVDASLPAGISSLRGPAPGKLIDADVDAELKALEETDASE
jgi:ParB-like chromosome segregation protein Spo0J